MLKTILFLIAAALLFSSCKDDSAINFNDHLVQHQRNIFPAINVADRQLLAFVAQGKNDSVIAIAQRMEKLIGDKKEAVEKEALPTIAGAKDYRRAFLNYFNYLRSLYEAYRRWANAKNEKDKAYMVDIISKLEEQKDQYLTYMQKSQKEYARKNNLRVNSYSY